MPESMWITAGAIIGAAALGALVAWYRVRSREKKLCKARDDFHRQREHLEAKFLQLAGESGKPRGLTWTACDFDDQVAYVRDKRTGRLSALVGVTVSFSAIEGGGMEDVEAVGNLRAATAVFHLENGRWITEGRTIFNLSPAEAVQYYGKSLERVPPGSSRQS